jgi:hypothetical protein
MFQVIQSPCQTGRLITTNQMIWQLIGRTGRLENIGMYPNARQAKQHEHDSSYELDN